MKKRFAFAVLLASLPASAASFVSVSCRPPLDPSVTTETAYSTFCSGGSLNTGRGYASASGAATLTVAGVAGQLSTLFSSFSSVAQQALPQTPGSVVGPSAEATGTMNYTAQLVTPGAQRSGYLQVQFTYRSEAFYDGGAVITSGFTFPSSITPLVTCAATYNLDACSPTPGFYSFFGLIPVTLGEVLTLESVGTLHNAATSFDGMSGGLVSLTYQFRFFESDRTTPVLVSETPEPSTWGCLASASILFGISRSVVRRRNSLATSKSLRQSVEAATDGGLTASA